MSKTTYHLDVIQPDGDRERIDFGLAGTALVSGGPSASPSFSSPSAFVTQIEDDTDFVNASDTTRKMRLDLSNLPADATQTFALPASGGTLAKTSDILSVFVDSAFGVTGNVDSTKQMTLDVDTSVPTSTTVTLTVPSIGGTIALEPVGFFAQRVTSAQTIPNNTSTVAIFNEDDGTNTYTNDGGSDYNTTTGLYTARTSGYYAFTACAIWASNTGGFRAILIEVNAADQLCQTKIQHAVGTVDAITTTCFHVFLAASDTVRVRVNQSSGGNLDMSIGSSFSGYRIRPA